MTAVEWEEFSDEDLEVEKEQLGPATKFWKPKVGINVVRFLPKLKGWPSLFKVTSEHWLTTPTGRINFTCPRSYGEPCDTCEHANDLRDAPDKASQDLAYDMFSKRNVYSRIVDRAEPNKGVQIYKFGKRMHDDLIELREDDGDFTHPVTGFDVKIKRKGTTKTDTKYKIKAGPQSELGNMEWIGELADLHNLFGKPTPREQLVEKIKKTIPVSMQGGGSTKALSSGDKAPTADDDLWGDEDDD